MSETTNKPPLPDHLSIDPRSPHYAAAVFEHEVGIRFNGVERNDVEGILASARAGCACRTAARSTARATR